MGWFRALSRTNKLLLIGVVVFVGLLVFASNDFSVFSAERTYNPVKTQDAISVSIDLSRAGIQSDGISGDSAVDENTGSRNSVFREFSATGSLKVKTTDIENGRRSYASLERWCIANPTMYPNGWTCDQVPMEDIKNNPSAIIYGTPQEVMTAMMNTQGLDYTVYTEASGTGGSDTGGLGEIGEGLGEIVGDLVAENAKFAVTDYNKGTIVEVPISGSDEFSPQKYMGTYTAQEDSVKGWEVLTTTAYANMYTEGSVDKEDLAAFVKPPSQEQEIKECEAGMSFFECLGYQLGTTVGDLSNVWGAQQKTYAESNFSMTVMTRDVNDMNFSYELGLNYDQLVCLIYGEGDICNRCRDPQLPCPEASVEESFSLWAEGSAYPFSEKNVYMQDHFMGIFDTEGTPRNYISGAFLESYDVQGKISVIGPGTYGGVNSVNGKLFEVASRAPAMMMEEDLQLAAQLDPNSLTYVKAPGYTCEFQGKTTNGWLDYGSEVSLSGNKPVTLVGSNIGATGEIADDLSIKVGFEKALTKQMLKSGGYTATVDGNQIALADQITATDIGIAKYKDTGPTLFSYAGSTYAAFTVPIGRTSEGKIRYGGFLAEITGSAVSRMVQITDNANVTRGMNIATNGEGNLEILYQSKDGKCGNTDLSYCLYLAEFDVLTGTMGTPVLLNNSTYPAGYYTALAMSNSYSGVISGYAAGLPVLPGTEGGSTYPVVVYQSAANSSEKRLMIASGGNIVQFPDILASDSVASPINFKLDNYGTRHLVILQGDVAYHARWLNEIGGALNGYTLETLPLPIASTGASVKVGDIDFLNGNLVVMYTVYPKSESGSSAVVFLVRKDSADYWQILPDGSNTAVAGSVYEAFVIDENAIVDWTADNIKRPYLEGKLMSTSSGRVDAALGFGMFGWSIFVQDATGYSATSRVWDKVINSEYSFAYTTDNANSAPVVVEHRDDRYYLGDQVTSNLASAFPASSDLGTMSAGELMTLIDQESLAEGVEIVTTKLPYLQYVDNVWETNPAKASCWNKLKKYTVLTPPAINPGTSTERWKCEYDEVTGDPTGCVPASAGDTEVYSTYSVCKAVCTPPEEPEIPVMPPGGNYSTCTESWCFTGDIYGPGVQELTQPQRGKLIEFLEIEKERDAKTAEYQINTLCDIADAKNVSCPFMFAIWRQESSLGDTPSPITGRHLEFGCLLDGFYDSLEKQMLCAVDMAVENRGIEWKGAVESQVAIELVECNESADHPCQSSDCSLSCVTDYAAQNTAIDICGELCCSATTEFGYIMEKYTPNDSNLSHGNSEGRENLRITIQDLIDLGVITDGTISTSPTICRQK